jgi:predicted lipoprotein
MEAFIRFEQLKDGIYFAKIDPILCFDVAQSILKQISRSKWIIYDLRRNMECTMI